MMRKIICILIVFSIYVIPFSAVTAAGSKSKKKIKKEIAITFDELPAAVGFHDVDRDAVSYLILQALKKYEVSVVGFVIGEQIAESFDIIGEWLNAGHRLGNMTYSNQDLHELGIEQFLENVQAGEKALDVMVSGFGQKKKYFRYPYLHYGNNARKKEQVSLYLDSRQYHVVPVTVVIEDYLYNMSLDKMGKTPDSNDYFALMNEYLNHVLDEIEASERLSQELLGRECKQILRLRANRINAVFLDEMLGAIKELGYEFITVDKALKEELFRMEEAYFGGQELNYLQMIKGSDADHLPAE